MIGILLRSNGPWRPFALAIVLLAAVQSAPARPQSADREAFAVEDYFRLQRVDELALSSDGEWLAYVVSSLTPEEDDGGRRLYLHPLSAGAPPTLIDSLADARRITWIPGTHRLAFLRMVGGSSQVFSYDAESGAVEQRTQSEHSVVSFLYASGGRSLAYATRAAPDPAASLYDQFRNANEGILIDPDTISSHDFVNPDWNAAVRPPPPSLWVVRAGGVPVQVPVPGKPAGYSGTYFWSGDSGALSVVFVASDIPASQLSDERTSIGVFELGSGRFETLAPAIAPTEDGSAVGFSGGEWVPAERAFLVRRVTGSDPWVSGSFPDWAVVRVADGLAGAAWKPIELYPTGLRLRPLDSSRILLENTVRGVHSLFVLTPDGATQSDIVAGLEGSSSLFDFSADHRAAAFVNESLTRPPEIYIRSPGAPTRQLTHLNGDIAARVRHRAREVTWESSDGAEISGWLLEPLNAGSGPLPLITHVHGGPAFPFPNAFAPYFDYWPYPLDVYPTHGIAVFLPNYRGTHTYGRTIAASTGDGAAIEDIVTGVRALVASGAADPERLGISGHSHGALVGPLAMARSKIFRTSSFGEGVSNQVVMYELMSGYANREIHDPTMGVSLYTSPQTYIAGSADLQLEGVSTASLFEAGAKTSAIYMLGLAKAAERFGMPSEFIIYPKTAHNIALPHLQREAAVRNLDWFDFWLNGAENKHPDKAAQYKRWRQMRTDWKGKILR